MRKQIRLSEVEILEILRRLDAGDKQEDIAFDYEISGQQVSRIKLGHVHKDIWESYHANKI